MMKKKGGSAVNLDFTAIVPSIPYILKGIGVTLQIAIGASIIGFIVGILLALCKIGKVNFYVGLLISIRRFSAVHHLYYNY